MRIKEEYGSLVVHDYKHLLILQKDNSIYEVDTANEDFIRMDNFKNILAERMRYQDAYFETFVTMKLFGDNPTSPEMVDSPFEAYYWRLEEFMPSGKPSVEDLPDIAPRFSVINDALTIAPISNPLVAFENFFISFDPEDIGDNLNSNNFLAMLLSNASYGDHAFSVFWQEQGSYFFKTSFFNKTEQRIRLLKHDNVMGLFNHNLLMLNMQSRISSGKELSVLMQSNTDGEVHSEMRGWELKYGGFHGMDADECENFLKNNSAGNPDANVIFVSQKST